MGVDLVGWRDCPLQKELGRDGFLGKLKLRAYQEAVEAQVPPDQRDGVSVSVVVNGPDGPHERKISYREIRQDAAEFGRGIPECATCPLSGGAPLGCHHYVSFPVDEVFERVLFDFFVSQLAVEDSIGAQLWREIVSLIPAEGTGWHIRRGPDARSGALARLPAPLTHEWGGLFSKMRVDSAQILQALFIPLEHPALVVAYARFWSELVAFAKAKGLTGDSSPTLAAGEGLARMLLMTTAGALTEGWTVIVDA